MEPKRFGQLVEHYRKKARWSQDKLAREAGVGDHSKISRLEKNDIAGRGTARNVVQALATVSDLRWRELRELAVAYLLTEELQQARADRRIIGLVVPSIGRSMFWGRVVGAIEERATEAGYLVVLCQHRNNIDRHLEAFSFFENFDSLRGVISAPPFGTKPHSKVHLDALDRVIERLHKRGVPTVFLDRRVGIKTPVPYVGLDNETAAFMAVNHLIAARHRRIGALLELPHASPQQERLAGYRRALKEAKIPYDEGLVRFGEEVDGTYRKDFEDSFGYRRGLANARDLLRLPGCERPTAIFCGTGRLALDLREAAKDPGVNLPPLDIPGDVSVIGFDNLREFDLTNPTVSRVQYDTAGLGWLAIQKIEQLDGNVRNEAANQDVLLGVNELRIEKRESVRAPRTG